MSSQSLFEYRLFLDLRKCPKILDFFQTKCPNDPEEYCTGCFFKKCHPEGAEVPEVPNCDEILKCLEAHKDEC